MFRENLQSSHDVFYVRSPDVDVVYEKTATVPRNTRQLEQEGDRDAAVDKEVSEESHHDLMYAMI